ncbi:Suppressor protein stp22 of temperature-sensitive alpha-factor receptor and arginine permease [Zalaria obscura]|uniref:Suppressor protein stp22 of temperature-sensitive alpha-factor receptor and arginine permease n=1 Tax=Zalaria obscura TaxID=2024903 RepID=A0ACC3SHW6_9PEZI
MAQVPQQTLQWLYNVLSNDYQYPQPTYSLVASALSRYPSLVPRTDVYTYENGHSDLLLALNGNLPVTFRGNIYRFPIELWIPKGSPAEAPFVFVRAEGKADIAIRPGQHVGVDGRVYHPYLRDWGRNEPSNIVDLLRILQDIFAKEPPVVAKQQQQKHQPQTQSPRPPPPPKERPGVTHMEVPSGPVPPPKPPKPGEEYADRAPVNHQRSASRTGPPLPPLPHELEQRYQSPQQGHGNGYPPPLGPSSASYNQPSSSTAGSGPPPLPPLPPQVQQYQQGSSTPVSPLSPNGHARFPDSRYQQAPPLPHSPLRGVTVPSLSSPTPASTPPRAPSPTPRPPDRPLRHQPTRANRAFSPASNPTKSTKRAPSAPPIHSTGFSGQQSTPTKPRRAHAPPGPALSPPSRPHAPDRRAAPARTPLDPPRDQRSDPAPLAPRLRRRRLSRETNPSARHRRRARRADGRAAAAVGPVWRDCGDRGGGVGAGAGGGTGEGRGERFCKADEGVGAGGVFENGACEEGGEGVGVGGWEGGKGGWGGGWGGVLWVSDVGGGGVSDEGLGMGDEV